MRERRNKPIAAWCRACLSISLTKTPDSVVLRPFPTRPPMRRLILGTRHFRRCIPSRRADSPPSPTTTGSSQSVSRYWAALPETRLSIPGRSDAVAR